jgi:hypothetical protein
MRFEIAHEAKNPHGWMRVSGFEGPPLALAVFIKRPQAELKSALRRKF